jgi:hypothetical protein
MIIFSKNAFFHNYYKNYHFGFYCLDKFTIFYEFLYYLKIETLLNEKAIAKKS